MEVLGFLLAGISMSLFALHARRLRDDRSVRALLAPVDGDAEVALHVANHAATSRNQQLAPLHVLYGLVQDETFIAALRRTGVDPEKLDDALLDELERFDGTASSTEPYHPDNAPFAIVTARVYARHHGRDASIADVWQALAKSHAAELVGVQPARIGFALIHGEAEPRAALPGETAVHVILRNDDYTTFEFVMAILRDVFGLSDDAARAVTSATHKDGRAIVGRFDTTTAKQKVEAAWARARDERFPLWVGVEVC